MAETKADSRLLEQIEHAELHNQILQAWFTLRPEQGTALVPSPERTKQIVEALIRRVSRTVRKPAKVVRVLDQLGSFRVLAAPSFLRALSSQPEIASARPASLPGFELIHPVTGPAPAFLSRPKAAVPPKRVR